MYKILDLDNCVSDDAWRIPFIDWTRPAPERYRRYHSACSGDRFVNAELLNEPGNIIVMTGRPNAVRAQTQCWLHMNGIPVAHLMMRADGDYRRSVDVKLDMVRHLPDCGVELAQVVFAADDRQDIVDMYREHGIRAYKIAIHSVDAYRAPEVPQPDRRTA